MCFIEIDAQNFIPNFWEIFLQRKTVLRAHRMKFDGNSIFCQIYAIFLRKMEHVIDRYFSLFLKDFEDFS